jgi:hypothetical protein
MGQDQFVVALNKLSPTEDDVEAVLADYVVNHLRSTTLTQADAFRALALRHALGEPSRDNVANATWPINNPVAQTVDLVLWKWVGLRFGRPRLHVASSDSVIHAFDLNDRGRAALGARLLSPRSSRFLEAGQGLPPETLGHLECAVECWEAGVLRPGFIMLGLAFEEVTKQLHGQLQLPMPKNGRLTQSFCLDKLTERLRRDHTPLTQGERSQAETAISAAKEIAELRNKCGHPHPVILSEVTLELWLSAAIPWLQSIFRMSRLSSP